MRIALSIIAAAVFLGCSPADQFPAAAEGGGLRADVGAVAGGYRKLQRMTTEPVYVDPQLAMLCRGATQADVEAARKASGPHAHTAVSIYMNDVAADAFRRAAMPFPIGSIIVKEKRALDYWGMQHDHERIKPHDGVGGMIKRSAGYDPEHGDWEYFYFEDPASIERGRMSSCVQCHNAAASTDHVFGGWARGGK